MNITRICCGLLICLISGTALAFKPFNYKELHDEHTHEGIIQLMWTDHLRGKDPEDLDFDFEDSDNWILMPNAMVDLEDETGNADIYFPFHPAEAHCDNETIEGCARWIYKKTECAVNFMKDSDWTRGYHALGTAFHALQDLYSHSNWIDLSLRKEGNNDRDGTDDHVLHFFGQKNGIDGLDVAIATGQTCIDRGVVTEEKDGKTITRKGNSVYTLDGLDKLTTGYVSYVEPGKCNHGSLDGTAGRLVLQALDYGINKDDQLPVDANVQRETLKYLPHLEKHDDAYLAATAATLEHLQYAGRRLKAVAELDVFKPSFGASEVEQVTNVTLFPRGTSLAFGISGSQQNQSNMLEEMTGSIRTIVSESQNRGKEVKQYVLTSGGGDEQESGFRSYSMQSVEDTNRVLMTSNGNNLLRELDVLSKSKSTWNNTTMYAPLTDSGCAEFPSRKLKELVVNTSKDGNIFYRTDASAAGQQQLLGTIEALALRKNIAIYFLVSGSCASEDTQLESLAHATGGHSIVVDPPETDLGTQTSAYARQQTASNTIRNIVKPFLGGKLQSILLASGTFEDTAKSFLFPVDATITQLVVTAHAQNKGSISLSTPAGEKVLPGEQGVSITELANGRMFVIEKPKTGSWELDMTDSQGQSYSVSVKGNSPIAFSRFQFYEKLLGRHGLNYFPLTEQNPVQGKRLVKAYVNGLTEEVDFQFRDVNGTVARTFQLNNAGKYPGRYKNMLEINSNNAFRVYFVGRDAEGNATQRVFPRLFHGQTIAIKKVANTDLEFSKKFVRYEVTNSGADDNILITIRDQLGQTDITRTDFIHKGETIQIDVKLPASSPMENDLTITAVSAGDQSSGNRLVGGFAPYIAPTENVCNQMGIEIGDVLTTAERASVRIIEPKRDSEYKQGNIQFEGTAEERIFGDLTSDLIWSSNIDGKIGTGGKFTYAKLSAGEHIIKAGLEGGVSETTRLTVIKNLDFSLTTSSYWWVSKVNLRWSGATNGADIYRDGRKIDTGPESGSDYYIITGRSIFKVCASGTNNCSTSIRSK